MFSKLESCFVQPGLKENLSKLLHLFFVKAVCRLLNLGERFSISVISQGGFAQCCSLALLYRVVACSTCYVGLSVN